MSGSFKLVIFPLNDFEGYGGFSHGATLHVYVNVAWPRTAAQLLFKSIFQAPCWCWGHFLSPCSLRQKNWNALNCE